MEGAMGDPLRIEIDNKVPGRSEKLFVREESASISQVVVAMRFAW